MKACPRKLVNKFCKKTYAFIHENSYPRKLFLFHLIWLHISTRTIESKDAMSTRYIWICKCKADLQPLPWGLLPVLHLRLGLSGGHWPPWGPEGRTKKQPNVGKLRKGKANRSALVQLTPQKLVPVSLSVIPFHLPGHPWNTPPPPHTQGPASR